MYLCLVMHDGFSNVFRITFVLNRLRSCSQHDGRLLKYLKIKVILLKRYGHQLFSIFESLHKAVLFKSQFSQVYQYTMLVNT